MNDIFIAVIALGLGARFAEEIRKVAPITDPNSNKTTELASIA